MDPSSIGELTIPALVEVLADAGAINAGVEILEAWALRGSDAAALVPLRARLFSADEIPPERQRQVLEVLKGGVLESLARSGALLECGVACRVLAAAFPGEAPWADCAARFRAALQPLPGDGEDPDRERIDELLAVGSVGEALEALQSLMARVPDAVLAGRLEELQALLADPLQPRPVPVARVVEAPPPPPVAPPPETPAARIVHSIQVGDITGALRDVAAVTAQSPGNPRWIQLYAALARLGKTGSTAVPHVGPWPSANPVADSAYLISRGMLRQAQEYVHAVLPAASPEQAAVLGEHLGDLDTVLDGTLPTPLPPRPEDPLEVVTAVEDAAAVPMTVPASVMDTLPDQPPPPPPVQPSAPPATGSPMVSKRKIVRLG